jgi:apolipoprotein N-acyltransferase
VDSIHFHSMGKLGAAAYSQIDSPAIQQSISLFGMAELSFLIYWMNASVAHALLMKRSRAVYLPALILAGLTIWGGFRLDLSRGSSAEAMKVAAVGTDSEIGTANLPSFDENTSDIKKVFERTRNASAQGAELVVWNEASFFLLPENESAWMDSISDLAQELNTSIVAAYVVAYEKPEFHFDNKYIMVTPNGSIDHSYMKHEPVPGEPATPGTSAQQTVELNGSMVGGAICYDYDFPYLARDNKKAGADIVGLPSSDWRGIDPIHTQMAAMMAIEQGNSIVRSTRIGLSAAITPYGVMNAQMSSFDENDKIMIANVPSQGITTLYSLIGKFFVWLCLAGLAGIAVHSLLSKKRGIKLEKDRKPVTAIA